MVVENRKAPQIREATDVRLPHVGRHPCTNPGPEAVVCELACRCVIHGCGTPAAQTAHERVHDHLHETGSDYSVEGVAALFQYLRPQLHCKWLRGSNYASHSITSSNII